MTKLNCSVGDLAITVKCRIPENMGKIVRIVSAQGFQEWVGGDTLLYTWNVEAATVEGYLNYQGAEGLEARKRGPVPDKCLRRLTPPAGYAMKATRDTEPLQMPFPEFESLFSQPRKRT